MSSFSSDFTKIRLHYTNLLNRLPLMPSVPEPTYTLPEDASSEDIYELINTLPLPSRCKCNYNQIFKDHSENCDIPREPVAARCPTPRPRRKSEKNRRGRRRRRQRDFSPEKRGSSPTLQNESASMSCFTQNSSSVEPHDCKLDESSRQQGTNPPVPLRRQSCPPTPSPPPRCRLQTLQKNV